MHCALLGKRSALLSLRLLANAVEPRMDTDEYESKTALVGQSEPVAQECVGIPSKDRLSGDILRSARLNLRFCSQLSTLNCIVT